MSGLDCRLHAWLTEPDEQRFERAFNAYYLVAFPAVVHYLARLSHWDSGQLEDLAQEALLKFFDKVGRGRRDAAQTIAAALSRLRPLRLGAAHERQVTLWTDDVATIKEAAMGFRAAGNGESIGSGWKAAARGLTDRLCPLQAQGWQILVDLDLALHCAEAARLDVTGASGDDRTALRDRAERFAAQMTAGTASALAAERRCPGVREFCADVLAVIERLPRLQVPTNSFLFEIAASTYLDESKKRRRQKRSGMSLAASGDSARDAQPPALLETPALDAERQVSGIEDANNSPAAPMQAVDLAALSAPMSDPAQRCENEDLFEKFYLYLRAPLDNAARDYQATRATGRAAAASQRRRLESLTNKFARMMSVLSLLGEGYSQEHTALTLKLSRNQVKYIVEGTQRAYAEFAAAAPGSAPRTAQRDLHVR